jgi:hypothetical protein
VKLFNYRIVNVLSTCVIPFPIDLNKLADKYQEECSYEPELHPGATFKIKKYKATFKIFAAGSITLTAPSVDASHQALLDLYPIVFQLRKFNIDQQNSVDQQQHLDQINKNILSNSLPPPIPLKQDSNQIKTEGIFNNEPLFLFFLILLIFLFL